MQLGAIPVYSSYNYKTQSRPKPEVKFGSAKEINLSYILKNREHLLPERMRYAVRSALKQGEDITLQELHNIIYAPLMQTQTLEEARILFPEFEDVRDFTEIADKFLRSARVISARMPLEDFSLDCLKKIWFGTPQEQIVKSYGFRCRDVLSKICKTLNIPKPEGNYLMLLKTSSEEGNRKVAEATRRHLDTCMKNLALANIANKTPEARAKQAASMRRFYDEHPEKREAVSIITKAAWEKCGHIKQAMAVFTRFQPPRVIEAIHKQKAGSRLSESEQALIGDFYKRFWANFPNLRKDFSIAKIEAAKEFKKPRNDPGL